MLKVETDHHNFRKMSQEIKRTFREMGLKFQNLRLTILFKIAFFIIC